MTGARAPAGGGQPGKGGWGGRSVHTSGITARGHCSGDHRRAVGVGHYARSVARRTGGVDDVGLTMRMVSSGRGEGALNFDRASSRHHGGGQERDDVAGAAGQYAG